ncbi:hypothetical protein [Occultella kanbiaonis]|uniref:COG4315 family predicted lipoprotein n=1 Tax=Occultella kanbiaonis TaxID=2675754 RepID=UPI0013D0CF8F|nr:hypothetical protein [Occultella kanbiaonis]
MSTITHTRHEWLPRVALVATTVLVEGASGASLLTDADGRTLYVSEQEQGEALCTGAECTAVWIPLTVPEGGTPTGPADLAGTLGTLVAQDGRAQVTLDDRPLYTFALDTSGGETTGEGVTDTFDGVTFTWHAATVDGTRVEPGTSDDGGSGY